MIRLRVVSTLLLGTLLAVALVGVAQQVPAAPILLMARSGTAAPGGGGCEGDPCISSMSGTLSHGSTLTINGEGFGSHADYGGASSSFLAKFNDFESSLTAGGWAPDGQDPENLSLSTSSPPGGASTQFYRKSNVGTGQQGAVAVLHASTNGVFYTRFRYRESASTPETGTSPCAKFVRHYMADAEDFPEYNWYLGPNYGNTTGLSAIYMHDGRYSGTAAGDVFHPQDVWRVVEVIEYFGTGTSDATSIYGSADYFEQRLDNVRLIRRGSDLASNHIPAEGTNANENDRWVESAGAGTADGHDTSLGSHLCDVDADDAYLDFDDAYLSYTIARVVICAESTYSACDSTEIQPPLTWSDTQITVQLNRGPLTLSGSYLYVIDESNNVSSGFLLITLPPFFRFWRRRRAANDESYEQRMAA